MISDTWCKTKYMDCMFGNTGKEVHTTINIKRKRSILERPFPDLAWIVKKQKRFENDVGNRITTGV